jgi:hypothetical protein
MNPRRIKMKTQTKTIIVLMVIILLLLAGLTWALVSYGERVGKAETERDQLLQDLKQQVTINENLSRAASEQLSEGDLRKIVDDEMKDIQGDLRHLNAKVISVSRAVGRVEGQTKTPSTSDLVVRDGELPAHRKEIEWQDPESGQELPVAWAVVKPVSDQSTLQRRLQGLLGVKSDEAAKIVLDHLADPGTPEWLTGTHPIEFHVTAATAEVDGGVQTQYIQLWAKAPDSDEKYPLAVVKADFLYTDPAAPEFRYWTPHIDAGLSASLTPLQATGGGTLGLSIASYGVSADDNIWRFGRMGLATDMETGWLEIGPAGYNLGKPIPVISDAWIWPNVVVSPDGYGVSVSLTSTF